MTENSPQDAEPLDVGPAAGGDRPATDADRWQVVDLLYAAHAEGYLGAPDRDARVEAARRAVTFDDLVPLTRDLVTLPPQARPGVFTAPMAPGALPPGAPAPVASPFAGLGSTPDAANPAADQIVAVFSGTKRRGLWQVRRNISALLAFGGVDLDMTEATFEAPEVTINVFCVFGGMEVTIPDGVEVRNSVIAIFGGVDNRKIPQPIPGMPVINVKGFVCFGGIDFHRPKLRKH